MYISKYVSTTFKNKSIQNYLKYFWGKFTTWTTQ